MGNTNRISQALNDACQKVGFHSVEETAVGATLVKQEYEKLIKNNEMDIIISSCCHSVNLLISMHFPQLRPHLAPVVTPMSAHCQDIKRRYPEATTVFVGPLISKKDEACNASCVDAVLTFEAL